MVMVQGGAQMSPMQALQFLDSMLARVSTLRMNDGSDKSLVREDQNMISYAVATIQQALMGQIEPDAPEGEVDIPTDGAVQSEGAPPDNVEQLPKARATRARKATGGKK